jgi:hypothetical protein
MLPNSFYESRVTLILKPDKKTEGRQEGTEEGREGGERMVGRIHRREGKKEIMDQFP